FMAVFSSGGVGIDIGSANVTICLEGEGVVLREPSYVLTVRDDPDEVLAVGRDARAMLGRTPNDVTLHSPIMDGAVGDVDLTVRLMRTLSEKALGKRRALEKSKLVVSVSQGCTRVETQALENAVRSAGAKRAALLRAPVAAAIGAGVAIDDPRGCLVIVIGGSTTEVSVITMNGIAAARSTRTGSLAIDEAIMRYIRREKGLIIGQRTAEDLKIDFASAAEDPTRAAEEAQLRGRDARTGKPATVTVTAGELHKAILPALDNLLESIREAFENTPAEMAEDIISRGVFLSGGGALLEGLPERLSQLLNLPITVGENPQDDIAVGLCRAAYDERIYNRVLQSGCLYEL
ncbi:MAG: rod shape-determining protein, partial [Clostridia bacterium]|nr:rod shape-determining protein [Clostridia bacterium]